MYFQQYVLKGILIGTALFFPTNAYAEEANHTPKLSIQTEKAALQKQNQATVDRVKKSKVQEKPREYEKTVVKKPTVKSSEKKKVLSEQASLKAKEARQSTGKKQTGVMNASTKKVASRSEKKSIDKKQINNVSLNKKASKQDAVKNPLHSKENKKNSVKENEFVHEINIISPIVIRKSIMPKASSLENQESPRNQKTPDSVTSFPDDVWIIFSQGSYHSGETAKDRKNTGYNSYGLNDKWFMRWEKYWILGSNQSFVFQNHKISSQWMNAPPFQPPKCFLFS